MITWLELFWDRIRNELDCFADLSSNVYRLIEQRCENSRCLEEENECLFLFVRTLFENIQFTAVKQYREASKSKNKSVNKLKWTETWNRESEWVQKDNYSNWFFYCSWNRIFINDSHQQSV